MIAPGSQEKSLFLKAVAQLRALRELHMPQWEAVVGGDVVACVDVAAGGCGCLQCEAVRRVSFWYCLQTGVEYRVSILTGFMA